MAVLASKCDAVVIRINPANIAVDVTEERLARFFTKEERGYRARKEIREMVIFAPQNLIMDPPTASLQSLADQLVLQRYAPPAVLANDKGDIVFISGRTGKYLEPAADRAEPLAASSKRFARRLLTIGENRLELLSVEVPEERVRLRRALRLAPAWRPSLCSRASRSPRESGVRLSRPG